MNMINGVLELEGSQMNLERFSYYFLFSVKFMCIFLHDVSLFFREA